MLDVPGGVVERLYVVARVVVPGTDVGDVKVFGVCAASAAAFAGGSASRTAVHHVRPLYGNVKRRRASVPSRIPLFALADQSLPVYVYMFITGGPVKKLRAGGGWKGRTYDL